MKGGDRLAKKNIISVNFNITFDNIERIDGTLAKGRCAIAYCGNNRNWSNIEKDVFEKALPSLKNKPVVGNYLAEKDDFGAHDFDIVETDDSYKIVPLTKPIGVVPESANQWWEVVTEEDGTEREYLMTDILLWRREEGFDCIQREKKFSQSMEISVLDYSVGKDGIFVIKDFEFEALTILGREVEPCFESANVQLFTKKRVDIQNQLKQEFYSEMASLSKRIFEQLTKNPDKGGNTMTKERFEEILAEYGVNPSDVDFEITESTTEEDVKLFAEGLASEGNDGDGDGDKGGDGDNAGEGSGDEGDEPTDDFTRLQNDFEQYKKAHSHTNEAYEALKAFKDTAEAEARKAEFEAAIAEFPTLAENEEFKAICEKVDTYETVESFKHDAYAILGKAAFSFSNKSNDETNKTVTKDYVNMFSKKTDADGENPYGDIFV